MPQRATTRTALIRRTLAPAGSYSQIGERRKSQENALNVCLSRGESQPEDDAFAPFGRNRVAPGYVRRTSVVRINAIL
jgi:hypothetical protein